MGELSPEEADISGDAAYLDGLDRKALLRESNRKIKPLTYKAQRTFGDDFYKSSYKSDHKPAYKWASAGGVVVKALTPGLIDQVYLVKPSGAAYGKLVFPKGRIDLTETDRVAATREVSEEAGILARHVSDGFLGEFEGAYSKTRFFLMYWVQDSKFGFDHETQEVVCLPIGEAFKQLEEVKNFRDIDVLRVAQKRLEEIKKQWK